MSAPASPSKTFRVTGMSCGHCEAAVQTQVAQLAGVDNVTADASAGTLTVVGTIDEQALAAAVAHAGYELAP